MADSDSNQDPASPQDEPLPPTEPAPVPGADPTLIWNSPEELGGLDPEGLFQLAASTTDQSWQPPSPEDLNAVLPGYEVKKLIGRGGMGAVYEARHLALDRHVALKFLSTGRCEGHAGFADRARREARMLSRLDHPNIVSVFDSGTTSAGDLYFTMELVTGENLARRLRRSKLSLSESLAVLRQVCAAVDYAHSKGVVHRDLKPSNILLTADGRVKVADFGLAVAAVRLPEEKLTHSGVAMGTFDYSAPEQMLGEAVDARADIYSIGVITYELLTGEIPRGAFDPPSLRRSAVDAGFDSPVLRALQTDRERRYGSAAAFFEALMGAHETALLTGADEVLGASQAQVLQDYYEKAMVDVPPTVRIFIEDKLLTPSGYRDSRPLDDALSQSGVTRTELERLVERRLLRIEERAGVPRVEISHDRLTGAIQASRDARRALLAARDARAREHLLRRRMWNRLILVCLLGLALAAGIWGWSQKREAMQRAEDEAEARRQLLAMADLTGDLAERMEPIGRLRVLDPLIDGMENLFTRYRPAREDAAWNRLRARFLTHKAAALAARGKYTAAVEALREALALPEGLSLPDSVNQRSLLMHHLTVRGLAAAAMDEMPHLQQDLERLPTGADKERAGALALAEYSRALQERRFWTESLAAQENAIQLMENALMALSPDDKAQGAWQHELARMLLRLAEGLADAGQAAAAQGAARRGHDLLRALAASPGADSRWLATHAGSWGVLGNVLLKENQEAAALEAFTSGLEVTRLLTTRDPENILWLREHARALAEMGGRRLAAKQFAEAVPYFDEALGTARTIAGVDPAVGQWQWDLATYLLYRGYVETDAGNPAAAEPWLREAISVMEPFALSSDAPVPDRLRGLGAALVNLGDALRAGNRAEAAVEHYTSWITRARREAPNSASWYFLSSMMGWELGDLQWAAGQIPEALQTFEAAVADLGQAERLLARDDWPSPTWAWRTRPARILTAAVRAASAADLPEAKRIAAGAVARMLSFRPEEIPQQDAEACALLEELTR